LTSNASGGLLAAPAWADFYAHGWREDSRDSSWPVPAGLAMRVVDGENGLLANQWCPIRQREWFVVGTEPRRICDSHTAPTYSLGERIAAALKHILKF
jgi:penicillin-binding protein 1A